MRAIIIVFISMYTCATYAARKMPECVYQRMYCPQHMCEVRLPDGSRVDCLTDEFAIEFDFADKWPQALGQALYYADMTGRKPVVVLILEQDKDTRFVKRAKPLYKKYNVGLSLLYN